MPVTDGVLGEAAATATGGSEWVGLCPVDGPMEGSDSHGGLLLLVGAAASVAHSTVLCRRHGSDFVKGRGHGLGNTMNHPALMVNKAPRLTHHRAC